MSDMSTAIEPLMGTTSGPIPAPGMVWIPAGTFQMGSDHHYPEEAPAHPVKVDGFWMDATPVTNAQFRQFVDATGYVTFCEIPPDASLYPGAQPVMRVAFHRWRQLAPAAGSGLHAG